MNNIPIIIILLTGFKPFNHDNINSAWEAVCELDKKVITSSSGKIQAQIVTHELPCVFSKVNDELITKIKETKPAIVISVGQRNEQRSKTEGRIDVENFAVNKDNASKFPDEEGDQPMNEPIVKDGPPKYSSTLFIDIDKTVEILDEQKIPASKSESAGSFVCNHAFYILWCIILKLKNLIY